MKNEIAAYKEILKSLNKYKDIIVFDVESLETKSKLHLFGIELKDIYGLDLDPKKINSFDWNKIGEFMAITLMDGERKKISWSDDGKQPKDELLLYISFPTGAYIFGGDYPTELFQKFFLELKTYSPKYTDSHNHSLYFSMDNAKTIFNSFNDIMKKYHEINKIDIKQRKIKEIKKELEKLQSN